MNEVNNTNAIVLTTAEPLPNKVQKLKKLYTVLLVTGIVGWLIDENILLVIGLFGIMILFILDDSYTNICRKALRADKFKFINGVTNEEMFDKLQPILISKYNMMVEKDKEGRAVVSHNGCMYDIIINNDATFSIWWRKSIAGAMLEIMKYKTYKKVLAAMGIIGYEIQNAFEIK